MKTVRHRPLPAFAGLFAGWGAGLFAGLFAGLLAGLPAAAAAAAQDWPVAGQQGLVRYVIVPAAQERDAAAYQQQIGRLCDPERSCFLNFYTNRAGADVGVPLPEAIAAEATATFRRSMKNGAERFQWSCRMKMPQQQCF